MKAVAYRTPGPNDREDALQDITLEKPKAEGRDLLVKINAVSVNPVDTKLRMGALPEGSECLRDRSLILRISQLKASF